MAQRSHETEPKLTEPVNNIEGADFTDKYLNYDKKKYDLIYIKTRDRYILRKKKRKARGNIELKILSRAEILTTIQNIPEKIGRLRKRGLMYRALIATLYLTGGRINEILTLKKNQFEFTEKNGQKFLIINNIPTLKRRQKMYRTNFLRKDFENDFIVHVRAWMDELYSDDALLFPIKASRAWQIVYKYTGMFDHYFRHVRATDLVRYYHLKTHYLKTWFGWGDSKSADFYVELAGEDLRDEILNANIGRNV